VQIGVVSGIVSLKRWKCVVTGFANHAGTTPMNCRRDALAAAAKHLLAVREVVRVEIGTQVGTVGYLRAEPGAPNVIPGASVYGFLQGAWPFGAVEATRSVIAVRRWNAVRRPDAFR
jgi:hypothetical protein